MQEVFNRFKELFEKRYSLISVLDLGEDSIRYDFFLALKETKNLEPWQIQLEYPLHKQSYIPRKDAKSKRNENPQIDLFFDDGNLKVLAEFGFFRKNSNDNGSISVTENIFKMFNDFIRMALHSTESKADSYFVCVADSKMLDTGFTKYSGFKNFPANEYKIDTEILDELLTSYKSARDKIDIRFLQKMQEQKIKIKADNIYEENISSKINPFETKIIVWKVNFEKIV